MVPIMPERIPEDMTIRQNGSPRDGWLIALLLRFDKMFTPSETMHTPRKTNPDPELRRGQLSSKYFLKTASSEMIKNTALLVSDDDKGGRVSTYC